MNIVTLLGRVGKDPEISQVGQSKVAKFSLAVFAGKDKEGNYVSDWFNIEMWGKQADLSTIIKKGSQVCVNGKIKIEKYTQNNQEKTIVKIIASTFTLCSSPVDSQASAPVKKAEPKKEEVYSGNMWDDDDVPF